MDFESRCRREFSWQHQASILSLVAFVVASSSCVTTRPSEEQAPEELAAEEQASLEQERPAQERPAEKKSKALKSKSTAALRRVFAISKGKPLIVGSLDKTIIHAVVDSAKNQRLTCEKVSAVEGEGVLHLKWVINNKGLVSRRTVELNETRNEIYASCMLDVIKSLVFPPPPRGGIVIVHYPFHKLSSSK